MELQNQSTKILRLKDILQLTGLSKSTNYERIKNGLFPRPVKLGQTLSGWPAHEVDAINRAIIAGRTDDEIRKLVTQLEVARKIAA